MQSPIFAMVCENDAPIRLAMQCFPSQQTQTYWVAMPITAMMAAPRLILMYLGHRPAMSMPHDTALRTSEIL